MTICYAELLRIHHHDRLALLGRDYSGALRRGLLGDEELFFASIQILLGNRSRCVSEIRPHCMD